MSLQDGLSPSEIIGKPSSQRAQWFLSGLLSVRELRFLRMPIAGSEGPWKNWILKRAGIKISQLSILFYRKHGGAMRLLSSVYCDEFSHPKEGQFLIERLSLFPHRLASRAPMWSAEPINTESMSGGESWGLVKQKAGFSIGATSSRTNRGIQ